MQNLHLIEKYIINNSDKLKINSNEIKKGDIFISLQGKNFHGNKFLNSSIKNGAKYCITDKKIKGKFDYKKILFVEDIFIYLNKLSIKKRELFKGKVIGITGSAGKTTLKETLKFFLSKKYNVSASQKSYNNHLGVILSILNINLKSQFAIFELGTNDFGEIKNLVKLILPTETIITNIQSTHLKNFKNKLNIAVEKSDIFNPQYNLKIQSLFLLKNNSEENFIFSQAKKDKIKNIITIGKSKNNNCYINKIIQNKNEFTYEIKLNQKKILFKNNNNIKHKITNILFCLAIFKFNNLSTKIIINNINKLKAVDGRGHIIMIKINNKKIKFIDETYNANPDTMRQSIEYFNSIKNNKNQKILVLGDMNELGIQALMFHSKILKFVERYKFDYVILCGEFFETAISKLKKLNNIYIIKKNENDIIKFIKSNLEKNAILMAKCSNSTSVNKFGKKLINMKGKN